MYGLARRWSVTTMFSLCNATPQRRQQGVRDRLRAAVGTAWRRQQGGPCDSALGGAQQAVYLGVRGLRSDLDVRDASQACWPHPRRERHADVADAFRPHKSGACAAELPQRGLGGSRRDEPAERTQLRDGVRGPAGQEGTFRHAR